MLIVNPLNKLPTTRNNAIQSKRDSIIKFVFFLGFSVRFNLLYNYFYLHQIILKKKIWNNFMIHIIILIMIKKEQKITLLENFIKSIYKQSI